MVTENEYKEFVDTGHVNSDTLLRIAVKVKNSLPLTKYEKEIFYYKTKEINELIINIHSK